MHTEYYWEKCQRILTKFGTEHLNIYEQIPFSTTSNQHNL